MNNCSICYKAFENTDCEDYLQGCHEDCFVNRKINPKRFVFGNYRVDKLDEGTNEEESLALIPNSETVNDEKAS